MPFNIAKPLTFLFLVFCYQQLYAKISLPAAISNNMVLQQKTNAALWGKATPNTVVSVTTSWNNKLYQIKADADGSWKVKVATPKFGGPYIIDITDGENITLKNVLIGDVWLCSGQSNMEMALAGWGKVLNYEQEIALANYSNIRLLQALHATSNRPANELLVRNEGWDVCTPATIADFSATAYFFAREIYNKTKVPIGLIHSSWGGTFAEAWTSFETLAKLPDFVNAAKAIKAAPNLTNDNPLAERMATWNQSVIDKDAGYSNGRPNWIGDNVKDWEFMVLPGLWELSVLPDMDGVVWLKKKINIPNSWKGQDMVLHFVADDQDVSWFNGNKIGATNAYDAERKYKISASLLKDGDNEILIRVYDTGGDGGIYGEKNSLYIENSSGEKISLTGNWLYKVGVNLKDLPPNPAVQTGPNRATVLYNAMINPLINYTIKGAIWYQGEANAERAYQYRTLFPAMIKDWRSKFSVGDFPFYFVQLANFMERKEAPVLSAWAELREAQLMTTSLKNTGMATIIDVGDALDIHPKNKQEVGRRLALIALNKVYKQGNEYSGPLYKSFTKNGNKITLNFIHANGIKTSDGEAPKGFAIAGADKKFYWADAKIQGNKIIVSSARVKNPVAVRYGWADNPAVNIINNAGLPASPFRTDVWPGITVKNK